MKLVKILGLTAVAAMAFMAFASAAFATELYSGATTLGKGTTITASLTGNAKFEDTKANVLDACVSGGLTDKTINTGGAGVAVDGSVAASGLTWAGCTVPTTTTEGGSLSIAWTSGTNGTVTGKGIKVSINTILFGTCVYSLGTGTNLGTLVGSSSSTASLVIKAVVPKVSGLCENSGIWTGTYTVTFPDPLGVENN